MKIADIKPAPYNPRKITDRQLQMLAKSMSEFGDLSGFVLNTKTGNLIGGHQRLKNIPENAIIEKQKLKKISKTGTVAEGYIIADGERWSYREVEWDLTKEKLANLAANKHGGDWDEDKLKEIIDELRNDSAVDIDLSGFNPIEIDEMLAGYNTEPDEEDDVIPEIDNKNVITKPGDLFLLGDHRLLCGDSTKRGDVERLMDGKKADMSFTSPPYNVGHNLGYKGKDSKYENSDDDLDNYVDLIVKSTNLSLEVSNEVFVNIQFLANNKKDILLWLAELSDRFKDIFFWKKSQVQPAMAARVANSQVEIIVLFGHNNNRAWGNKKWRGNFSNSIETKSASGENKNAKICNATFPVELPLTFITHAYNGKSIILDLFLGTGTTLIASEKTGRICYGMEIDPKYCDVIIARWEKYTGKKAIKC